MSHCIPSHDSRSAYIALGVDMGNVCRNAWTTNDIVQRKLVDSGVELQEEREWLADTTGGTEHRNFGGLEVHSQVSQSHWR